MPSLTKDATNSSAPILSLKPSLSAFTSCVATVCACSVVHSCSTLCDRMGCSPPGSSVHGILQAKITGVGGHFFLQGSSWPWDRICISCVSWIADRFFTTEPLGKPSTYHEGWKWGTKCTFIFFNIVFNLLSSEHVRKECEERLLEHLNSCTSLSPTQSNISSHSSKKR